MKKYLVFLFSGAILGLVACNNNAAKPNDSGPSASMNCPGAGCGQIVGDDPQTFQADIQSIFGSVNIGSVSPNYHDPSGTELLFGGAVNINGGINRNGGNPPAQMVSGTLKLLAYDSNYTSGASSSPVTVTMTGASSSTYGGSNSVYGNQADIFFQNGNGTVEFNGIFDANYFHGCINGAPDQFSNICSSGMSFAVPTCSFFNCR